MKRWLRILLLGACAAVPARGQGDGIFADFSTSAGDFTVQLDYERAPRAVASFVGLAGGETGWLDAQSNVWHRPFYNGSIFHRVVKDGTTGDGIAIQGGGLLSVFVNTNTGVVSTNFLNAGYTMLESVTNGLAHSNGVISMANSGPNTDGSQFFVTAADVPYWNGSYSVFGHVVSGTAVVAAIAAVPVAGAGSRPVDDVDLHAVAIRRAGAAAEAFDISGQGVPVLESGPMRAYTSGTNLMLEFDIAAQSKMFFRESADLQTWETDNWGVYDGGGFIWTTSVVRASLGDASFMHMARFRYSEPITTPPSHRGETYTFDWNTVPPVVYEARFGPSSAVPGAFTETAGGDPVEGQLLSAFETWTRDAYSYRLTFMDSRNRQYQFTLGFNPGAVTNRFTGRVINVFTGQSLQIDGTFTID